ncbi:sodium- and chloride-dependent GABA transporter ine isoform X1 [Photinus pyralis]|uniref:sodium- and chloride-dependent GABA transporter ine isoform X1 n=1 Tax=Photinus pyralis TaxID=7054 RepID=UPI001266F68C|nr:sodium- and chloride-dependent GABA transporter ine isoform X1 [Photinus pyralis]
MLPNYAVVDLELANLQDLHYPWRPCERSRPNDMPEAESPLGHWPHSLSSMLACLGCTVGLFNISRFAILSTHYGANFLIQFLLLSVVIGLPLFTLQLCLGQQLGAGVIDMWRISPLFQGVGVALLVSQAFIGLYSIIGVSWLFVYFRDSFITKDDRYRWAEPYYYYRDFNPNDNGSNYNICQTVPDYFSGIVLQRHHLKSGVYSGTIKFQLAFNLAVVWMIVFVSLSKGLRSYGKVVYVFSLLPVLGIFIVSAKMLSMIPSSFVYAVFPETSWNEFFLNSRSWVAASQEVLLTWGLLGAATMQIASHNKNKHLLQRDSSLIAIITFAILLLTAFLANTCVQLLRSHGYNYIPTSFEKISAYSFLQSSHSNLPASLTTIPVRYMPHQSFIVGERVTKNGIDPTMESGYQALRLATELVPATFAIMGTEEIYPFWAVLFYFILILFGIAQQLAIWHCVITGIMAIKANLLKSWETTITFFSCACGFLLGLPMATEYGIYLVYFMDFTIGGMWWLILIILLKIVAVFVVRGRPYSGDALVNTFFASQSRPCLLTWAPALLSFTWNVILPVGLMVCCVTFFKNGNFREMFVWHHAPSSDYWPLWARQVGSMLQLLPVLCVPIVAVIQSYRYLNNGPADILDRVQLLYRPPIGEHMEEIPAQQSSANTTTTTATAVIGIPATVASSEDPPPKYTPPPSYTTATGARIAKFLRQSIRRSVRRLTSALGESSSRNRATLPAVQVPPPDYTDVLVEMNQSHTNGLSSVNVITDRNDTNLSTFGRELAEHRRSSSGVLTIADVASILRNSFRRSRVRSANTMRNVVTPCDSNDTSITAQNLVDSAAPIGETSLVLDNLSNGEGEAKLHSDNLSAVI